MSEWYVLDGRRVVPTDDIHEWGRMFDSEDRRVAHDQVGDAEVSTVFLGIDHDFFGGPPLLFETMVFGGEHDQFTERYSTWDEAETGHRAIVDRLEAGQSPDELLPTDVPNSSNSSAD